MALDEEGGGMLESDVLSTGASPMQLSRQLCVEDESETLIRNSLKAGPTSSKLSKQSRRAINNSRYAQSNEQTATQAVDCA